MWSSILTFFGFFSSFLILPNEVNCFQRFAEQPKYSEVNPGQDALLTCKIIDKRGTCSWQKDNKPVGIYPKKYEWAGSSMIIHQSMQPPHIGGDCSLWVRSATLDFDDGLWECQVTASDFTTQDALTSQPVRLVVRVAPQRPRLEHEGVHVPPGHNVTVDSGAVATVKCISHYGNPPAMLRWFLGDQEISALGPQINSTEPDNSRTWSAASVVQVPATRERHGEMLKCLAFHESYAAKSVTVEARMDVKYAPTIRLLGAPEIDLEEGKDTLILRCEADANPPANIVWRRAGRSEIASLQESLQLRPVGRRDAGLYTCQAQNSVGTSEQLSIQLDVKYPPRILSAGPDRLTTAPLFSPAAFECVAEGNPPPTYKWVQRISQGSKFLERGHESRLVIDNVTYDFQGEYECRATNFINGQERTVSSEPVSLQVVGAPQVLRLNPSMHSVSVKKGDSASLSLVVCADPRPHHVAWEWGSLRLEAGAGVDRYRADEVTQDSREDCYLATLHITKADEHDARPYYLVVENERGTDRHAIHLSVEGTFSEPLEMSYLLGIAGGCLAALLILICLCIYAVRAKKCCFKGRSGYKSSDKDSEKADLKSRSDSTSGPQGDSIYTTPAGFHHHHHTGHGSPEAMKSTTLQNGLLWQHEQHQLRTSTTPGGGGTLYTTSKLGTQQRHHRDLFTGDLGIPEITTRVGSVVHTFETMAMLKRQAEKPYDDDSKYSTAGKTKSYRSNRMGSNSKYSQMKKKSTESRQKFIQSNPSLSSSLSKISNGQTAPTNNNINTRITNSVSGANIAMSRSHDTESIGEYADDSVYNIDDDYRKNLFGTQPNRKRQFKSSSSTNNKPQVDKSLDDGDEIVNKAFNVIFNDYDDDVDNRNSSDINNTPHRPAAIEQRCDELNNNNRPNKQQQQALKPKRSSTLTDIFECAKNKGKSISKYPSSSLLSTQQRARSSDFNCDQRNQNHPHFHHHTQFLEREHQRQNVPPIANLRDDNENFLRGSTVSQSFIKNVRSRSGGGGFDSSNSSALFKDGGGDPSGISSTGILGDDGNYSKVARDGNFLMTMDRKKPHSTMMNQQKRSKSSTEIVGDPQRKHFHDTQPNVKSRDSSSWLGGGSGNGGGTGITGVLRSSKRSSFKPKTIDKAEI